MRAGPITRSHRTSQSLPPQTRWRMRLLCSARQPPRREHVASVVAFGGAGGREVSGAATSAQACRVPGCEGEKLYMGAEKRNGVVITDAGNKWSNLEYFKLTGIREYVPYMFGGGCGIVRPGSAAFPVLCGLRRCYFEAWPRPGASACIVRNVLLKSLMPGSD